MIVLICGLLLWTGVHLFPALAAPTRQRLISRLGLQPYRGLFALLVATGLVLIVVGWQRTSLVALWYPPAGLRHLTILLMWPAVIMAVAAYVPGNPLRARLRHPLLMAVGTWALAHLLANGEVRSLLLFGTLLVWSFVEIRLISQRDGRTRPAVGNRPGLRAAVTIVIGTALWMILMLAHPHFAGRAVLAV